METRGSRGKATSQIRENPSQAGRFTTRRGRPEELSREYLSYRRLLFLLVISIFLAEVVAMGFIYILPPLPYHYTTLIDAGVMTALIFPALYILSFRPLVRHIEKRQQAESAVRQLSRIVEQTEDTVVVTDCSGVIEYVNPSFERLTGFTKEEVLGNTPRMLKSGMHDFNFYRDLWDTVLRGEVFQSEIANRKKNGELFYEVKTITPLRDANERITEFVATGKDITERKRDEEKLLRAYNDLEQRVQDRTEELRIAISELEEEIYVRRRAEEALRQSEQRLNRAQEIAHLGSWELDLVSNQLTWSDEVYRIFGMQPHEFGASYEAFLDAVHPDDRAAVNEAYAGSIREGRDRYEIEHRIVKHASGEVRVVHEKCEHFRDEQGQIVRSTGMVHDITERKQADEQLRYQAALLSNVNDAIIASDAQFHLTAWNSSAEALYGWKAEEALGRNGLEIVRTEWAERDAGEMRRIISETGRWRGEATQMRRDGSRFPVEVSSIVLRDDSGQVAGYISVNRDITERKQAEIALRESEEKFRSAFANAAIGFAMTTPNGRFVDANPAYCALTGHSIEELRTMEFPSLLHPHDHAENMQLISQMLAGEIPDFVVENRYRRAGGDSVWVRKSVSLVRDVKGNPQWIIALVEDITKRKEAEEALKEAADRFRIVAEFTYDWEYWRSPENHFHFMSPSCERITGYPREAFDNDPELFLQIVHPDDRERLAAHYHEDQYQDDPYEIEFRIIRQDGQERWLGHACRPVLDKQGRGVGRRASNRDITERKQAEEDLRNAHAELEQRVLERTMELAVANRELVKEIAERKEIERQLRLQTTAMEAAANGIVITDYQGTIQWSNPALLRISGYEVAELIGKKMHLFNSGQQDAAYYSHLWETILSGEVWRGETINLRKDGTLYFEEQTITPVRAEHGQITHFIAIKQDITERKQAEEKLEQRNQELQIISTAERNQRQFSEALIEAALTLNRSLKLSEVLTLILNQIKEVISYQLADIIFLEGDTFYDASHLGEVEWSVNPLSPNNRFLVEDFPLLKNMRQSGKPALVPDAYEEPDWTMIDGFAWVRSLLSAPLLVDDKVIGFVNLFSAQRSFFTPEMSDRLVAFAAHAAVAIQNAWLFEQVQASTERLQSLSRRLVEIQENERLYISRELHDEAGQVLTSLLVDLRLLEKNASQPETILKIVSEMERSLNGVIENLHRMAMALRPASLDHVGLVAALRQQVEAMGEKHGIQARFRSSGVIERLPGNVETVLYRTVQEALTNVVRHAQATRVDVVLMVRDDKLVVLVEDDGVGFDPTAISTDDHLGLFGIRERSEMIGARLVVESEPGKGTTIMMEVGYADTIASRR